ncbi:hypothetical protein [Mammaliicoccus sciuri]|uniref:hypothetical protein n=1 Tax=Mammaliicoccus sciuri TaxID=1296 RepID=UPI001FB1D9BB|nr:hypothetical protein [Mammaliicoccus sciuri]MCJ1765838.1 hypothetical protein [Mammaliicoccus sciuri]MCJ1774680.1 hypothetical protein [Mammaliicoccus sciuri]
MEKTNAEIINDFNSIEELTEWLIKSRERDMKLIQYEFYGTGDEDEYKEDEAEINALHAKYNELTN